MKTLNDYYPSDSHEIEEVTDKKYATSLFNSKTSPCWGAGKIGDTGYYQLVKNIRGRESKTVVLICKNELLNLDK
jgi:hypothetical protein